MHSGFYSRVLDVIPQYIMCDEVWGTRRKGVESEFKQGSCNIIFETGVAGSRRSVEQLLDLRVVLS